MKIRKRSILLIRSACIVVLIYLPALAVKPESKGTIAAKDLFIINEVSGPPDTSSDALVSYIDYRSINNRAKSLKLTAVEDSAPYVDNTAFFLVHPRIEVPVSGLEKGKRYNIFVDFVRYRGKKIHIDGILKIFIKDAYGNEQLIGIVNPTILNSDKIFTREIPFNLSYSGSFTIIMHEYSVKTGNWGIWDIIVTSKSLDEIVLMKPEVKIQTDNSGTKIFN